jgi:hypothetical protein
MMFTEQPVQFVYAPRRDSYSFGCGPVYSRVQYAPTFYPHYREVVYYEPEPIRVYRQRRVRVKPYVPARNLVNELDLTLNLFQSILGSLEGPSRNDERSQCRLAKKARREESHCNSGHCDRETQQHPETAASSEAQQSDEKTTHAPVYRIPIVDHNQQEKEDMVPEDISDNESVKSGNSANSNLSMIEQLRARTQSEALITENAPQDEGQEPADTTEALSFKIQIQTDETEDDVQSVHSERSQKSELSMVEQLRQRNASDSILEESTPHEDGWEMTDLEKQTA